MERRPRRKNTGGKVLVGVLTAVLVLLIGVAFWLEGYAPPAHMETDPSTTQTTVPTTTVTTVPPTTQTTVSTAPTEPPVVKVSTAAIANTGDMLMHGPIITGNYDHTTGTYDFTRCFRFFADYVSAADLAVANLEVTMYGPDFEYYNPTDKQWHIGYCGYPRFNCPDILAQNLKDAGFDLLLTANNHTYDTGTIGFHRTQQVLQGVGMDYLGTVPSEDVPLWQVREVNGIRIGMVCYTYQTGDLANVSLNGLPMSEADGRLIGTFSYAYLDAFYQEMQANMDAMEAAGAEAVMLYIHWGDEYHLEENWRQNEIAQALCDLGVDVIVGGHPHVVQPMELLTSNADPSHKTVCLYSMGNAISNQRKKYMDRWDPINTEDGLLFTVTFAKYSDGTVILESAEILPLWVNHYLRVPERGQFMHEIIPLDKAVEDWKAAFGLGDEGLADCLAAYDRTMAIVGEGLSRVQEYLARLVAETETALGVAK